MPDRKDTIRFPLPDREREHSTERTLLALNQVDDQTLARLSALPLPEIARLKREVASVFPAGNLPGLILAGLTALKGRQISRQQAEDDIQALFSGADLLPQGLHSILIGGPAVVLSAYQMILTLAGKDTASAFPEGIWQFYTQSGLREDTAHHTCETTGYHSQRPRGTTPADDLAAWVMAAIYLLFDSDALSGMLWSEWTALRLAEQAARRAGLDGEPPFRGMIQSWRAVCPCHAPPGAAYAEARRAAFEGFLLPRLDRLPAAGREQMERELADLAGEERPAYQRQMSLLAALRPGRQRDERIPIPLWEAHIGLIWRGHTTLLAVCAHSSEGAPLAQTPGGESWPLAFDDRGRPLDPQGRGVLTVRGGWLYRVPRRGDPEPVGHLVPADPHRIRSLTAAIIAEARPPAAGMLDLRLAAAPRSQQEHLRSLLPTETRRAIRNLAAAPVLINWDEHDADLPLGTLRRQARRGCGDHPLTIIRTAHSVVFDLSPIFFDAPWGMTVAEMLTDQAAGWCEAMGTMLPQNISAPRPLSLVGSEAFERGLLDVPPGPAGVDAETTAASPGQILQTRRWLRERGVPLTVGDLLVLARFVQAARYSPAQAVSRAVFELPEALRSQVVESLEHTSIGVCPVLLLPVEAALTRPRERVFPATFRSPLTDLPDLYDRTREALRRVAETHDDADWAAFEMQRRELFAYVQAFAAILSAVREIARRGESLSAAALRLTGHLPASMQHLLNQLPEHISLLSEVLKGEEVFYNLGRASAGSSLRRFTAARDDGRTKSLVWSILTDDAGTMHITLRDFRPHVGPLLDAGQEPLARLLAQDYLDSYARFLNQLTQALGSIALAEDEIHWS